MNPVPKQFFKRKADTHKGNYGHVLVVAGSRGMTGAPVLSAESALRSGAGWVTLAVPRSVYPIVARKVTTEIMVHPLPDAGVGTLSRPSVKALRPLLKKADVLAVGPGLSRKPAVFFVVRQLVTKAEQPIVLDADGVIALAGLKRLSRPRHAGSLVMTPHPGEMAKFLGITTAAVQRDREKITREVAKILGAVIVLKGHHSVVAAPTGKPYINRTGNPGMASAGMGDLLTGLIAALIGQGLDPFTAAKSGVYLHGLAGDLAVQRFGQVSLTASDVQQALPAAFQKAKRQW